MFLKLLSIAGLACGTFAAQATTTHYSDGGKGACGCGAQFDPYIYTAAGSPALFGSGTWCGTGCGACYTLTSTGTSPPGEGTGGGAGVSIMVVISNLCPNGGNEKWCPTAGSKNAYGYSAHFDINTLSGKGQFDSLGWNNPIVNYSPVQCPSTVVGGFPGCECSMTGGGGAHPPAETATSHTQISTPVAGGGGGTAAHYAQCGGAGYSGPTTCTSPYTCAYTNAYYSQCL